MTLTEAQRIIQSLADGCDPFTGTRLPSDSVLQHPDVIRALCTAALTLKPTPQRTGRISSTTPANQGKPWTALEDKQLCDAFDAKTPIRQLAAQHQRTTGAIKTRLGRLGRVVPPPEPVTSTRTYPLYVPRTKLPNERSA